MIRRALLGLERIEALFYASPWSTGVWILFCAAWLIWARVRHEVVGWDGVATMFAGAIALATIRRLPPLRLKRRWFE